MRVRCVCCVIDHTVSVRPDNAASEVETGSSMAAGGDARRPQRKLSVCDLHIHTRHEDRTSACREIRAILREIRDSLQLDVTGNENSAAGNHDVSAGAATSKCVQMHEDAESPARASDVQLRQRRDGRAWSGCRHCRLSLPARLRPGHVDGLFNGDMEGPCSGKSGRRRVPASVRFADELGMNLNTFAMIPSRQVRDDSPLTRLTVPQNGATAPARGRHRSPPPPPRLSDVPANGDDELPADGPTLENREVEDNQNPAEANHHEQFRLCFGQPFADLDQFRRRLDRQQVCLENVRVDDWTAGAHHNGVTSNSLSVSTARTQPLPAANSVILCSIQTSSACRGGDRAARVFARCTSDNWRTFADLPAQRVTGLDSLGLGYERYCFAVRRPATPEPRSSSPSPALDDPTAAADGTQSPSAVVEFAVCYELVNAVFWDNNDEANYRIEWFENAT